MARKKKNAVEATSPIVYKGEVTIKTIDKKGRVKTIVKHNQGQQGLFTYLTKNLQGTSTVNGRPQQIMLYTDSAGTTDALISPIPYTGTPYLYYDGARATGNDSDGVEYTFMIPFGNIKSSVTTVKSLKLLNDLSTPQECAFVQLADPYLSIEQGTNIMVYWRLTFSSSN